ncbi:MAG: hypothetical protein U1E65_01340 [Myxococcota bacterium]
MAGPLRVFLGLSEVSGYYRSLRQGFEELGHPTEFIDLSRHPFQYGGADRSRLVEAYRFLAKRPEPWLRGAARLPKQALFAWAAARFDVFIFGFGQSFLGHHRDLPILKALKKKLIFQFHGSDARPAYLDGSVMAEDRGLSIPEGLARVHKQKVSIREIERYADAIVNIPTVAQLFERPYLNWLRVGLPNRPGRWPSWAEIEARPLDPSAPLRILHSPSHPAAKGSVEIRAMVEQLRSEGFSLELVELRGRPNAEVLAALESSDIVFDQLYADYGMPGFACEAAWFARPVLIAGYAVDPWRTWLPEAERPPTRYVTPGEALEALRGLCRAPELRRSLGHAARRFVETAWHPRAVAQRYLQIARGEAPAEWWLDPRQHRYWRGCGLPEERARALIAAFLAEGGASGLQLDDKPEFLAEILGAAHSPLAPAAGA